MKINPGIATILVGIILLFSSAFFRNYPVAFVALPALAGILLIIAGPIIGYIFKRRQIKEKYKNHPINRTPAKITFGSLISMFGAIIIGAPIGIATLSYAFSELLNCKQTCIIGGETFANLLHAGFMLGWLASMTLIPGLTLIIFGGLMHKFAIKHPIKK